MTGELRICFRVWHAGFSGAASEACASAADTAAETCGSAYASAEWVAEEYVDRV
jgi:hypothetical protein